MPGGKIFISYRRGADNGVTGRLHDRLERNFSSDQLFIDIDAIPLGRDFIAYLDEQVAQCDVFMAVIGPGWLESIEELNNDDDFVRIELEAALNRPGIPIIPVLVDGAAMPLPERLPETLRPLLRRNGLRIDHHHFAETVDGKLARALRDIVGDPVPDDIVDADFIPVDDEPMHLDAPPRAVRAQARTFLSGTIAPAMIGLVVAVILIQSLMPSLWNSINSSLTGDPYPGLSSFTDCAECPEMIVIPGGTFTMGSPGDEADRDPDEGPRRKVTIGRFALATTEVTFAQWQACVDGGGCLSNPSPKDEGWGRGDRPVINVSWDHAQEYIDWLNEQVEGAPYRLPYEVEWEYAARAGTTTPFAFGETIESAQASFDGRNPYGSGKAEGYRGRTVPVGDLDAANEWGLRHMHGNVWERVADCWKPGYEDAPSYGSAWHLKDDQDCPIRPVRGGSWDSEPRFLRSSSRVKHGPGYRLDVVGLRPAKTLSSL